MQRRIISGLALHLQLEASQKAHAETAARAEAAEDQSQQLQAAIESLQTNLDAKSNALEEQVQPHAVH